MGVHSYAEAYREIRMNWRVSWTRPVKPGQFVGQLNPRHRRRMKESSMSTHHPTDFQGSVSEALREAIEQQISNSRAEVNGGGGHYNIKVTSPVFAGKGLLESQRLVYGAIAQLMKGKRAPVHAVDSLKTHTPE